MGVIFYPLLDDHLKYNQHLRNCQVIATPRVWLLPLCGVAVLRSEGSRDEGRGKRQEEGVGSKQ